MQTPRDRIRRAMNRQFSQEVPPSDDILVVTVLCQGTSIPHISLPFSLARKISGKTNILSVRPHLKFMQADCKKLEGKEGMTLLFLPTRATYLQDGTLNRGVGHRYWRNCPLVREFTRVEDGIDRMQLIGSNQLIAPYQAKPTTSSPSTSCSHHHVLHSRHNPTLRTSTANRVRQPHQLSANQRHIHLIEFRYCEDTRPGQELETAQRQHAEICRNINGKAVTLHTILLGVGGSCYTEHTLHQFKELGPPTCCKLDRKLPEVLQRFGGEHRFQGGAVGSFRVI
eukprot:1162011-Pelagomonas_calceolata.AAC.4